MSKLIKAKKKTEHMHTLFPQQF